MTRFQLVFRNAKGDRPTTASTATRSSRESFWLMARHALIREVWLVTREALGEMPRFVCTLVAESSGDGQANPTLAASPPVWGVHGEFVEPGIP